MILPRDTPRHGIFAWFRRKVRLYRTALLLGTALVVLNSISLGLWKEGGIATPHIYPETKMQGQFPNCTSELCIQTKAKSLARVWQRHSREDWCVHVDDADGNETEAGTNTMSGLWLIKVPKSASSTIAGIVLRIADLYNCSVRWQHATAAEIASQPYRRNETFWVAPIRHPYSRALSSVYYHSVSLQAGRGKNMPADAHVVRQLDRVPNNYIADYTRLTTQQASAVETVQEILDNYDFLPVVEELEASLVVWAWLAHLNLPDMVVMSSKTTGSWYATGRGKCVSLVPPVVTPAVTAYWQTLGTDRHLTDRLLHAVAVQSLRKTIQNGMGEPLFQQHLTEFRRLQAFVQTLCGDTFNQSAPCSPVGLYQPEVARESCFIRDFGCGHHCVDRAVQQYDPQ